VLTANVAARAFDNPARARLKQAHQPVAVHTKKPAHDSGSMNVINVESSPGRFANPTDRADLPASVDQFQFFNRQAI
jgi:hypothetical protein